MLGHGKQDGRESARQSYRGDAFATSGCDALCPLIKHLHVGMVSAQDPPGALHQK